MMKNIYKSASPHFTWRSGNHFELLMDGEQFFPAMLESIAAAQRFILLEMYLIKSGSITDQFIEAFLAAAERGVQLYLLLDDFGSMALNEHDRHRLHHPNIKLCLYNPLTTRSQLRALYRVLWENTGRDLHRTHRKLLLVDGDCAYVGGCGLTDDFIDAKHLGWREVMIRISGAVVYDWHQLFIHSWIRYADASPISPPPAKQHPQNQLGRVVASDGRPRNAIRQTLLQHIQLADQRVWLATAYFAPSWRIRRHLRKAARRGVDVRLLLPGPLTDHPPVRHAGRRFYTRLLKHGVRIFEYQPRVFHAKVVLCDQWLTIGSSNFDHWGLRWNQEANQEVEDPEFATQVAMMLEEDFTQCQEYHYHEWCQRNWYARLRERFWGAIDRWLAAITNRLQRRRRPK